MKKEKKKIISSFFIMSSCSILSISFLLFDRLPLRFAPLRMGLVNI